MSESNQEKPPPLMTNLAD